MRNQIRKASLLLLLAFLHSQPWLAAQKSNSIETRIDSLNKAFNDVFSTDLSKAEKLAIEARELSAESGYSFGEATANSNLSAYYLKKENYTKSIEAGLAALKIYDQEEKYKNTFEYGNTFIRLAKSFFMEKDYDRSKAFGHQAISVAKRINDPHLLALGYEHLGNNFSIYSIIVDSALFYYNKAKTDFIRTNYVPGLANVANNTGAMYSDIGNHQEAIKYFREALTVYQKNNLKASFTTGHYNMAFTYFSLKSYTKALLHADSAAYYAEQFKRPTSLLKAYLLKAQTYAGLGNVDSSTGYYEKSIALKDSIQSDNYKKELAALQTQSDVYKKEMENQLLAKDKRIAVLYRNLAIAGVVGLVILLCFILLNQRFRIHRQVKNQLEEEVALRTQEIFRQKETIFHTNLRLKLALNDAKLDSHFAVNMLSAIRQVVLEQSTEEAQIYLSKLSRLMQYILEKSPLDRVPLSEEVEMIEHYIQLEQLRLKHHFDYSITVNATGEMTMPAFLLQPYIANAIHESLIPATGKNPHLHIQIETNGDELSITIADNGEDRRKKQRSTNNLINYTIGKERMDLLTHLTHKNHLVFIEDVLNDNGHSAGNKIVLQIPVDAPILAGETESIQEVTESIA